MRDKKAQMGNMMHLVIIVVILLIAALAIILLVSNNVDQVGTESQAKNKKSFGGIGTVLGGIGISCPGHATGSTEPVAECVEHNTKIRAEENKYDESMDGKTLTPGTYYCCTTNVVKDSGGRKIVQGECELMYTVCNPWAK